jgi:diadenosine tetraphosphate (Ap4A) HIT family hydrolase
MLNPKRTKMRENKKRRISKITARSVSGRKQRWDKECQSCQAVQGFIMLTNTPRVFETTHWTVEHMNHTSIKGWLILTVKRHCRAIHELTRVEVEELGRLLPLVCRAFYVTMKTEWEYIMQLAEGEGFHHVHFHVIARMPDWPEELRGRRVFDGVGIGIKKPLSTEDLTPLTLKIGEYLEKHYLNQ